MESGTLMLLPLTRPRSQLLVLPTFSPPPPPAANDHQHNPASPKLGSVSHDPQSRLLLAELKVLADGQVMKVQKSRQRRIHLCVYCHSKKIKCLRDQPVCRKCEQIGIECKYFINERVSRGGKKSARRQLAVSDGLGLELAPSVQLSVAVPSAQQAHPDMPLDLVSSIPSDAGVTLDGSALAKLPTMKQEDHHFAKEPLPPISELPFFSFMATPELSGPASNPANGVDKRGVIGTPQMTTLQIPIMNQLLNNMTNNYFKTNYSQAPNEEGFAFNLASFAFLGEFNLPLEAQAPPAPQPPTLAPTLNPQPSSKLSGTNKDSLYFNRGVNNFFDLAPGTVAQVPQAAAPSAPLLSSLNPYLLNPATLVNYLYGSNTNYRNDNLVDELNDYLPILAERLRELVDRYVNLVHILLPIVANLDAFCQEHERYWRLQARNTRSLRALLLVGLLPGDSDEFNYLEFYSLYFPIMYALTILEFEEYDNLLLNQDIDKYLKAFNKVCQYYNYPHGLKTIGLLLGNVIIQLTLPNPLTMEMLQIIRYAKFLQLHKDPEITLRIGNPEVVKFRRLLWWVIFGLDALTSHNFCLPPVCRMDDFNVRMPEDEEESINALGIKEKRLNLGILLMNVKFTYDRILLELVYHLHNGLSSNITLSQVNDIKDMILSLFRHIHNLVYRMNQSIKLHPPETVHEMNLINFLTNHLWLFVDRATMLLHKKILMGDVQKRDYAGGLFADLPQSLVGGGANSKDLSSSQLALLLSKYEDTFGHLAEANIIKNFNNSLILQLKFNQQEDFTYENMHNNLIPLILHNLNDFLKYNDFIKFGRYNWYVKRTIPLDLIILMFVIIAVKFKYEFMQMAELCVYVKLINKALFILNRKWFKNEKYKRMLLLTNLTWEYILKRYQVLPLILQFNDTHKLGDLSEYYDFSVTSYLNLNELFDVMDVPQPTLPPTFGFNGSKYGMIQLDRNVDPENLMPVMQANQLARIIPLLLDVKAELSQLNEKIYYDLRNNFVDINDYCAFYTSLEHILHELMDYINL